MKRLLDKTWAKLTAFFLTLLFGTMTVLGGLGVGILVSYDVFLDGGAYMRETMYESQCSSAIHNAYYYLRGTMANAGLLADDTPSTDTSSAPTTSGITDEEQQQVLDDLPRAFSESFSREDTDCHLAVINKDTREITFENFELTDSDKPLYSVQETFTLAFADGSKEELTIAADLLSADEFPGYSYLVLTWLLNHVGLTVFLTVLFLLLTLLCFGFSMASAGHWAGREGIHLTWLDKIPADVWLVALICAVFAGWDVFYELAFAVFCAALAPVLLLFLCAFAAQCKAGTVLRGTLIARVLRLVWRIIRAVGRGLRRTIVGLPLIWKTALVTLAVFFAEMLYGYVDGVFAVMKLVEFLAILYIALNLRILQKGGEKLAEGDLSQSIDTRPLIGDFKRYGQRMNELRTGMERAVREQTRAERMKTELITNVSHDIKTPLTSIVSYVDLLKKEEMPSDTAREYLAVLDRQSQRLRKLTEDLVEASKASTGNIPVSPAPTDLNVLLSQVCGEYQQRLEDQVLEPVLALCQPGPVAMADGRLLWRVLDNLMSNICKYAMPGTRVYLSTEAGEDGVRMVVKNISRYPLNISADELTERFVRGDSSRSTEGSGLGLSIATSLTAIQGGDFRLTIDGDLFKVTLTLPRAEQEEKQE